MKAPFPWFGGKSLVADLIWERFGDVCNYVEPFAGSLAVLLARPTEPRIETVNDKDCYLANFWRALQSDPGEVTRWADWPVNEADLHARHLWLVQQADFRERMRTDPDYYDAQIAGWWVWGICQWIGSGWCQVKERPWQQLPNLGNAGRGIHKKRPNLGNAGRGVHRPSQRLPHLSHHGLGTHQKSITDLSAYMHALADRLRRVRVCCGDWARICTPTPTYHQGLTGVFLDPPYADDSRDDVYSVDCYEVAKEVEAWCLENADNPLMRIALCGYEGNYNLPGWECVAWKANGGHGASNGNEYKERIWFSPHCLKPVTMYQMSLEEMLF